MGENYKVMNIYKSEKVFGMDDKIDFPQIHSFNNNSNSYI